MSVRAVEFYCGIGKAKSFRIRSDDPLLSPLVNVDIRIGGLHKAFETSNVSGSVVRAYDWDQSSCHVYETNYGKGIVTQACCFTSVRHALTCLSDTLHR